MKSQTSGADKLAGWEIECRIAGTAVMLLEHYCPKQPRGSRVFKGSRYTVSESAATKDDSDYKTLEIRFKGDSQRSPGEILQLDLVRRQGATEYQITGITSRLTPEDIERFTAIRSEIVKDLQQAEIAARQRQGEVTR